MVNDVGIHCSEKYVHYINRKRNPREFEWIEETVAFRPDTKFGNGNKRAFVLDKARVHEFLVENQDISE
jgi:hypothetical protein